MGIDFVCDNALTTVPDIDGGSKIMSVGLLLDWLTDLVFSFVAWWETISKEYMSTWENRAQKFIFNF